MIFQPEVILSVGASSIYLRGFSFVGTYFPFRAMLFFSFVMTQFVYTAFSDVPNVPAVMQMENGSLVE